MGVSLHWSAPLLFNKTKIVVTLKRYYREKKNFDCVSVVIYMFRIYIRS